MTGALKAGVCLHIRSVLPFGPSPPFRVLPHEFGPLARQHVAFQHIALATRPDHQNAVRPVEGRHLGLWKHMVAGRRELAMASDWPQLALAVVAALAAPQFHRQLP